MKRAALCVLALAVPLLLASPAAAAKHRSTITVVRVKEPARANATVAGFELDLVKSRKGSARAGAARSFPKGVSVFAVLAKQRRSDRVRGVLVVVNRAPSVISGSKPPKRRLRINLKSAALPKGYALKLKLHATNNVLGRHRAFRCGSYFRSSDLAGALKLAGPPLPNITIGSVIQAACDSAARKAAYAGEGEFLSALNARAGELGFVRSPQAANVVNGTATFNYPVKSFAVLADKGHQLTGCTFAAGTCTISSTAHPNDYALFTLPAPAAAGTALPIALATTPDPAAALPFRFFGMDAAGKHSGPLATSGP
ncbi:MAG TPA: hypothetical protein VF032_02000 [Thermoleophilaceae bacterium]